MLHKKSILQSLPVSDLNRLLDCLGLEKAWYSILATHLSGLKRKDLQSIAKDEHLKNAEIQKFNLIENLSVGEISAVYEYSLAHVDRDSRKESGQFFTPDDVAQMMAKKSASFPGNGVWVDPCSGIGNLSYWLIHEQKNPEEFLKKNIFLVDRDALALFIARYIFAVHFQKKEKDLFSLIKDRFVVADFLASEKLPKYDFALLNPPYVVVEADQRFKTGESRDLYVYFLERVMQTVKGFISITPQTFTNGQKFNVLRKMLIENFKNIRVYCFDNVPDNIFRGIKFGSNNTNKANSTRAGIIVARKEGAGTFKITPLLRWRVKERQTLLDSVDNFLVEVKPRTDIFPKLQKDLASLYLFAKSQQKTLAHLLSPRPTPFKLTVPSTPRYFISALKRSVNRSSFRTLYFYSEKERDIAYLLLNGSYMYWWWRVNDGGMTISERTLLTLPILDTMILDKNLLTKIERSEQTNLVVKKNAGKDNENVKHSMLLIGEINKKFFPHFEGALGALHNNSVMQPL